MESLIDNITYSRNNSPDTSSVCPVTELPLYYEECAKNPHMDVSQRMKYEIVRYSTFSTLKKKCPIALMKLSKAGFYHDVASESIRCCQCDFVYKNIQSNDDPMEIHSRNSPNCNFVKESYTNSHLATCEVSGDSPHIHSSDIGGGIGGSSHVLHQSPQQRNITPCETRALMQTVPMYSLAENQPVFTERNTSNLTPSLQQIQPAPSHVIHSKIQPAPSQVIHSKNQRRGVKTEIFKDLGICVEKPKYPKYTILAKRRESFQMWPKSNIVSPDDLSQAGFYYNGSKDRVHCFFCGGGLGEWERDDDPWIEHGHWFPNCPFVRQCKGDDFIKCAKGKVDVELVMNKKDLFQTAAFQSLLEMGYTKEQIVKAYEQIESKEMPLYAKQLLELIWDTEDKSKDECNQERNQGACSQENPNQEILEKPLQQQIAEEKQTKPDFKALVTEYEDLKGQTMCKVCMDEDATVVFLPCGHMSTCVNCAPAMRSCPICRSFVKGTVKAILS